MVDLVHATQIAALAFLLFPAHHLVVLEAVENPQQTFLNSGKLEIERSVGFLGSSAARASLFRLS